MSSVAEIFSKDLDKFIHWLDNAIPGEEYVYFIGDSLMNCLIRGRIWNAYQEGSVILYQRRTRQGYYPFQYCAKKTGRTS